MGETLIQRRRVLDEVLRDVKSFSGRRILVFQDDGTPGIKGGKSRASSCGNT